MDANPVSAAISLFGSESKLGAATGYSQVAINKAKKRVAAGGRVSADLAVAIDRATNGEVSKHLMRPDLFDPIDAAARASTEGSEVA